jgi:hypothetical protein
VNEDGREQASMGVDAGDDGDGFFDMFITTLLMIPAPFITTKGEDNFQM